MNTKRLMVVCVAWLSTAAWAIDPGPSSLQQKGTEKWLQLQISGEAASPDPQPAAPTERDLAMQRWLESYTHKIPEFYEQDMAGEISGGSN